MFLYIFTYANMSVKKKNATLELMSAIIQIILLIMFFSVIITFLKNLPCTLLPCTLLATAMTALSKEEDGERWKGHGNRYGHYRQLHGLWVNDQVEIILTTGATGPPPYKLPPPTWSASLTISIKSLTQWIASTPPPSFCSILPWWDLCGCYSSTTLRLAP